MFYFYSVVVNFDIVCYSYVVIGKNFSVCFDKLIFCFVNYSATYCDDYYILIFDSLIYCLKNLVICYFDIDCFYHRTISNSIVGEN